MHVSNFISLHFIPSSDWNLLKCKIFDVLQYLYKMFIILLSDIAHIMSTKYENYSVFSKYEVVLEKTIIQKINKLVSYYLLLKLECVLLPPNLNIPGLINVIKIVFVSKSAHNFKNELGLQFVRFLFNIARTFRCEIFNKKNQ